MIRQIAAGSLVLSLTLLHPGASQARRIAASKSDPLNVQQARALCVHSGGPHQNIWIRGYFQRGPVTDGPFQFEGALFISSAVKLPAGAVASSPAQRQGLRVFIMNTVRLARAEHRAVSQIRPGDLVLAHGSLTCSQGHASFNADRAQVVRHQV